MSIPRWFADKLWFFALAVLSACGAVRCAPPPIDEATVKSVYSERVLPSKQPLSVYFIGHSLVGRRMPALLEQLAPKGHTYASQLGWGAELQAHWDPNKPLKGKEIENNHTRFREAHEAVKSGDFDVVVLTEKIDLEASIKYHDSWYYLAMWSSEAWDANPKARVYLYETWHNINTDHGWKDRIENDLKRLWEKELIDRALAYTGAEHPIYVIPAGQVLARIVNEGIFSKEELLPDGIHMSEAANYIVALTHYAVIYGRTPVGLPHRNLLTEPNEEMPSTKARALQQVVWQVVTSYPRTGVNAAH